MSVVDPTGVALRSLVDMGAGDLDSFGAHIHPDAVNREAVEEPPACRGRGPEAFRATARWLRAAFPDLSFDVLDVVSDRGLVVIHATMSGTHRGPFVVYDAAGRVERAVAPTGRRFAVTQTHWYRLDDGLCVEHWANRDDQGMARQLGWVPPSPGYLLRCALATRRARSAR